MLQCLGAKSADCAVPFQGILERCRPFNLRSVQKNSRNGGYLSKGDTLGRASLSCPRAVLPQDPAGVHYRNQKALAAGLTWAACQSSFSKVLCQSFLRKNQTRDLWEKRSLHESVSDEREGGNS